MNILVIEDDAGIADLFREQLEDLHYRVTWVESFDEADQYLLADQPDLMIVDYVVADGSTAKEWLLDRKQTASFIPPFVMSTGQGDERVAVEMMKLGARDYLVKDTQLIDNLPNIIQRIQKELDNEVKLRNAELLIKEQLRFTELLMQISSSFINVPLSGVDKAILDALKEIAVYVKADRSFIFLYNYEQQVATPQIEWCNEVVCAQLTSAFAFTFSDMREWVDQHLQGEIIFIADVSKYKHVNVREVLQTYQIKSIIALPLMSDEKCLGFVSFDSITDKRTYTENEINLFKVFAQLLVNVHHRKEFVQRLEQDEEQYRLLFDENPQPMWIFDSENWRFLEVNNAMIEHYGYSRAECMEMDVMSMRPAADQKLFLRNMDKISRQNRYKAQVRNLKKNGDLIYVELISSHIMWNGKKAYHVMVNDVTEKKLAEKKLEEKKELLNELLFESSNFIKSGSQEVNYSKITEMMRKIAGAKIIALNLFEDNGEEFRTRSIAGVQDFDKMAANIFGYNIYEKKWKGNNLDIEQSDLHHMHVFDNLETVAHTMLPTPIIKFLKKTFNVGKIGIAPIMHEDKMIGYFSIVYAKKAEIKNSEIIDLFANQVGEYIVRKETEITIIESEKKYRRLFANNPQPMWIYDTDNLAILEVNEAAVELYEYTKDEWLSMSVFDLYPPDDIPELVKTFSTMKSQFDHALRHKHIKKNGEIMYVELSTSKIQYDTKNARHVMIIDVTDRKLEEGEMRS